MIGNPRTSTILPGKPISAVACEYSTTHRLLGSGRCHRCFCARGGRAAARAIEHRSVFRSDTLLVDLHLPIRRRHEAHDRPRPRHIPVHRDRRPARRASVQRNCRASITDCLVRWTRLARQHNASPTLARSSPRPVRTSGCRRARPTAILTSFRCHWRGSTSAWSSRRSSPRAPCATSRRTAGRGSASVRRAMSCCSTSRSIASRWQANLRCSTRYAAQADWTPPADYAVITLRPIRIQAWREANEISGRTLMRDGTWAVTK